ncbi:hypothetical protein ACIBO2_58655 [Nonomuraea sp. NPDC050022]|uniref:hypothetical protein n=1 Tax=unclassified Nonomuraea TaxID=2593643 RepID=UPI0033F6D433
MANASELAIRVGISLQIVGFTLIALGTSLPKLVTSIQAQRRGYSDLLVENLLGSNLINSLAGDAIIALTIGGQAYTMARAEHAAHPCRHLIGPRRTSPWRTHSSCI